MNLNWKHLAMAVVAIPCMLTGPSAAMAEDYPAKAVRVLVGFPPGSYSDTLARMISSALNAKFGQSFFLVENRPGANGLIGATAVAKSKADGYTLFFSAASTMTVNPLLYKDVQYNTLKDFVPITPVVEGYYFVLTNPTTPKTTSVASIKDLIALAKAKPGTLSYSSPGAGNLMHLAIELLSTRAEISMIHVPYKASNLATMALLAGDVDLGIDNLAVIPQIKAGKLKALAVTAPQRSPVLPEVPAMAEFFPGYDFGYWMGLLAPAGTPNQVVQWLNREIIAATNQPAVRELLLSQGHILTLSPQAFAARISAEMKQNADVIRRANIKVD